MQNKVVFLEGNSSLRCYIFRIDLSLSTYFLPGGISLLIRKCYVIEWNEMIMSAMNHRVQDNFLAIKIYNNW